MIASPQELFEAIRSSGLMDRATVDELARARSDKFDDVFSLSNWLVQTGRLTRYQVDQLLLGQGEKLVLGGYRLLEPLGEGGMGQVFKAWQARLNRFVAIKVIRPQLLATGDEVVQRFRREALAAAQLSHPNIVTIYDAGDEAGVPYIVMEHVDGIDLGRRLRQGGPLPLKEACEYVRQAALGLQHAHEHGMVHRDIKPSNLLVATPPSGTKSTARLATLLRRPGPAESTPTPAATGRNAVVKILDMGLARVVGWSGKESVMQTLTQEGVMIGSPDYIAPEQARNPSGVDVRADLYSLGCTFYHLLTGQPPFPGGTPVEKILMHQLDQATPVEALRPDLPYAIRDVVRRLMAKSPDERYPQPIELAEDMLTLEQSVSGAPATSRPVPAPPPPTPAQPAGGSNPSPTQQVPVEPLPPVSTEEMPTMVSGSGRLARKAAVLKGHAGCVMALTFTADGQLLGSSGLDGIIRLWDLGEGGPRERAAIRRPYGEVPTLIPVPDRPALLFGSALDRKIRRWEWSSPDAEPAVIAAESYRPTALAFSQDGKLMGVGGEGKVVGLWNVTGPDVRRRAVLKEHQGEVKVIAFAPDNKHLASGGQEGAIRLWEVGRFWCSQRGILYGHSGPVMCMTYSPDGALLASGGTDCTVRVWSAVGEEQEKKASFKELAAAVRWVQFLPAPGHLLGVAGSQVVVWDVAKKAAVCEWRLDTALPYSVAVSPDGKRVAVGGSDGSISLFELQGLPAAPEAPKKPPGFGWVNSLNPPPNSGKTGTTS